MIDCCINWNGWIAELFPNCLNERLNENGKPEVAIDFDQLRQELS